MGHFRQDKMSNGQKRTLSVDTETKSSVVTVYWNECFEGTALSDFSEVK